ncbi:MAG: sulfurtransferase [Egibacteraceae bacterium]
MGYAHPEVLVSTQWVQDHQDDDNVCILEVDYDPEGAYELGHLRNAALVDWKKDINDPVRRDILSKHQFENLMGKVGATPDSTLVLYGDMRNWFAAFAFWTFKIYRHADVRLMDGGRRKWIEEGREVTEDVPKRDQTTYSAGGPDLGLRAFLPQVLAVLGRDDVGFVDVRSPVEFSGEITAPAEYPTEAAQRGGHIPGAANVPWAFAINDDDTFKSADELAELYLPKGITPDKSIITYCRIGERSSHSWFVLKYLLGHPVVINYDGSWSEFGNVVGAPVEKTYAG